MTAIKTIQHIKKEELGLLTVLVGDDVGQYQLAKADLFDRIGFTSNDINYSYFDMSVTDYDQVELDLQSLPFFSDEKIVILDYFADLTTDKKRHLTDEDLKRFETYIENPNETICLIICTQGKLDSKRRLVKLLKRDATVFELTAMKESDFRAYFKGEIHRLHLKMSDSVFDQLVGKSNADFAEMSKNLAFLQAYKPDQEIVEKDIIEAIPKTLQDNLFDVTQFLLQGKLDKARSLVQDLRLQGEDDIKLLAILIGQFRLFLQVKLLLKEGYPERQLVDVLSEAMNKKVNFYQVKFALRDSARLSISFLKKAVLLLIETDYQIKTGIYDKEYLVDLALIKLSLRQ